MILGCFGLILYSSIRRQMLATVDHELAVRGRRFASGPLHMPPDLYQRHLLPAFPFPMPDARFRAGRATQRELAHEHLASVLDGDARRLAIVRRPHLLDREGHSVRPFNEGPWDWRAFTQISEQDLSRRLPIEGEDELAERAYTFNSMISRLESAFQSRERAYQQLTEAYEQQRRFTANASHELRTPLSRIKISASMALSQEQSSEEYRRALAVADSVIGGPDRQSPTTGANVESAVTRSVLRVFLMVF